MNVILKMVLSIYIVLVFIIIIQHHIQEKNSNTICNNLTTRYKVSHTYIKNKKMEKMYKIKYDFEKNNTHIICDCTKGSIPNKFSDIKVRDLINNETVILDKTCLCDKLYDTDDTYIFGNKHIKRFMINNDDSYFYML